MLMHQGQPGAGAPGKCRGRLIDLRRIVKTYETAAGDFTALKGVDLAVDEGGFVGVVGKSGSGKTTLLNVLAAIDRPTSGEVYIGGTAVHKLNEDQSAIWRGRHIGVVFQFFQLLPVLTVLENVMLPMDFCRTLPPNRRRERAKQLLDRVGILEQAGKLPAALSGGQQQRAAIARALANDPPIIVADEPTGNLDSHTAAMVMQLFQDLAAGGKTILVVTHERDVAQYVTRLVTLADGEIVDQNRDPAESPRHGKGPAEAAHA